jgi:CheY-like chemotaxis protein
MSSILVIDDDEALRSVMRRVLERQGHSVQEAADGSAGLALIAAQRPDVVVTDLLMPGKEGIETIVELRERYPSIAIVAVSGAAGGEEDGPLVDAKLLGASAILSKPFSVEEFLHTVETILADPDFVPSDSSAGP